MYVTPTDIVYNVEKLHADVSTIIHKYNTNINLRRQADRQDVDGLIYGVGSLYDPITLIPYANDQQFNTPISYFEAMYIQHVIDDIEQYALNKHGCTLGRARILTLQPKSTLTMHTDYGNHIRFHVPIRTNKDCMFIHNVDNNYVVSKMEEEGRLYQFNSSVPHTAINASRDKRTHLVVVGCKI